jgi:hypothetical protein
MCDSVHTVKDADDSAGVGWDPPRPPSGPRSAGREPRTPPTADLRSAGVLVDAVTQAPEEPSSRVLTFSETDRRCQKCGRPLVKKPGPGRWPRRCSTCPRARVWQSVRRRFRCAECGRERLGRRDARYCSPRCRAKASRRRAMRRDADRSPAAPGRSVQGAGERVGPPGEPARSPSTAEGDRR